MRTGPGRDEDPAAADEEDEDGATDERGDEEDSGRGFAQRAKILASGKSVIDEEDLADHLDDLELALLSSDVEMSVAGEILEGVKENLVGETRRRLSSTGNLVRDALREALFDVISVGQFDFEERIAAADKPVVIIFTGVNGVGKTTTIAKLSQYLEERGLSSVLANGDTYRAGANEQHQKHADNPRPDPHLPRAGLRSGGSRLRRRRVRRGQRRRRGAGRHCRPPAHLRRPDGPAREDRPRRRPDMTVFVDEAVAGQDAVNRAREFDEASAIDSAILTKADADSQGGAAISVAHVTGKPILFLGTGQGVRRHRTVRPRRSGR